MNRFSKTLPLILCAVLLAACGDTAATPATTDAATDTAGAVSETEAVTEEPYEYSQAYAGTEFHILNAEDIYNMRGEINREEQTGEALNDAMYERCRLFEEMTGVTFVETLGNSDGALAQKEQKLVSSGDTTMDVMYVPMRDQYKLTKIGALYNLYDFEGLNLDKPWWYSGYNKASELNGKLYSAAGASQLMVNDSLWCLYFNETMMNRLDIETPYERVRQGKWTMDELNKDIRAAANINGDSTFAFTDGGTAVYGVAIGDVSHFVEYTGEMIIGRDENEQLTFTAGTQRYYDVVSKVVNMLTTDDGAAYYTLAVEDGLPGSYITMFEDGRSLYLTAELCKTSRMRDLEWTFGIVPFPKYDEAQTEYYSTPFYGTSNFAIPVSASDPEKSAILGDVLTYISYEKVIPVYKEVTLEQKSLRNEESIEMLSILMDASRPCLFRLYNIGSDLNDSIVTKIKAGEDAVSSVVAKYESKILEELDKINNAEEE